MTHPPHQRIIRAAAWAFGSLLVVGAVLDALSNAVTLIGPRATYWGTGIVILGTLLVHASLRRWALSWVTPTGTVSLRGLGPRALAAMAGVVALLWAPRLLSPSVSLPTPSRVRPVGRPPATPTPRPLAPTPHPTERNAPTTPAAHPRSPRSTPTPVREGIRLTQRSIASPWPAEAPYAVQATIQTDQVIQNVHLQIECDAPITNQDTRLADQTVALILGNVRVLDSVRGLRRVYEFTLVTPAFAPEMPLVVILGSTAPIAVVGFFHPSVGGR